MDFNKQQFRLSKQQPIDRKNSVADRRSCRDFAKLFLLPHFAFQESFLRFCEDAPGNRISAINRVFPIPDYKMSLFEDDQYEYTDTFFVFFKRENLPAAEAVKKAIAELGDRFEFGKIAFREDQFESMAILSPQDFSAVDIVLDLNADVTTQIEELIVEFRALTLTGDDRDKLSVFKECNARFDLFHFEKKVSGNSDPDAFIDPGGLLIVLEKLRSLCDGVGLDPQSQMLL